MLTIDAKGIYYRELNSKVRDAVSKGEKEILLKNVNGQYYIGDGLRGETTITIDGVPGNDLAAFMDGPTLIIKNNAQDNIGNTMKSGKAGDFFGEYMAGGVLILLNLDGKKDDRPMVGDYLGTGMHGGIIFIRGDVDKKLCGAEVGITDLDNEDNKFLKEYLEDYCKDFNLKTEDIMRVGFKKLIPASLRPYGNLYAY